MFTGLVADMGKIASVEQADGGSRVRVETELASELEPGDSIAVGGACLTAAETADGSFQADVMSQTLSLTTLGALVPGTPVNLELALRASDRLGGHIVQGHVDGVGVIASAADDGIARRLRIEPPGELMPLIAERGSIAVDGVSLTVSAVNHKEFEVSLIPETLERTTLGGLSEGDRVNVECDLMARYLQRLAGPVSRSKEDQ